MSTAQIKAAFTNIIGAAGSCKLCTMQYLEDGKVQQLRFYVCRPGGSEEVIETRVARGESLIAAARLAGLQFCSDTPKHVKKPKKENKDASADSAKA